MKPVILRQVIKSQPFALIGDRRISKNGWLWECTWIEAVQQTRGPMAGWWLWEVEFTSILGPEDFQSACEIVLKEMPKILEQGAVFVRDCLKALSREAA